MSGQLSVTAAAAPPQPNPLYVMLAAWEASKVVLDAAKSAESNARAALNAAVREQLPQNPADGTHYVALQAGWRLKAVFAVNTTVAAAKVPDMLLELSKHGDAGMDASNAILRYKPELVAVAYKQLMPSLRVIVDTALTTSPATPVFTLVPPKDAAATN